MLLFLCMLETEEDKNKFIQIYETYRGMMWYTANEILQDGHLAEDAVQEAFLTLTKYIHKVDEPSPSTRRFLYTVTKSKAIDIYRARKGVTSVEIEEFETLELSDNTDILESYISEENYKHLVNCIRNLKEEYRVVFELKHIHELSDSEIAEILQITPKLANVRYYRARKKLQEMIKNREGKNSE